jgi:hypothetical protein
MSFAPKLTILPAAQRLLWEELANVPPEFTLYGGTAIAMHLGHRQSVDFDFFSTKAINTTALYAEIPFLHDAKIIQQERNTLTCLVDRSGPVKVSFFGLPNIRSIEVQHIAADNQLKIASLIDLAGMKAAVVQQRPEAKDYIDLDAIMRAGVNLPTALAAAKFIYGPNFNPQITLKALSYFDDGDLWKLPDDMKARIVKAVAATDLNQLPALKPGSGNKNDSSGGIMP